MRLTIICLPSQNFYKVADKAVVDFVWFGYISFTYRQKGDIKRYMNSLPDKEKAASTILNASLPFLKSDECERLRGQLSYIVLYMKEKSHPQNP